MRYIAFLLFITLLACKESKSPQQTSDTPAADTTIVTYNSIYHGKYDSSRCVNYSVSIGGRNTGFTCSACQHMGDLHRNKVDIMLLGQYGKPIPYGTELRYLQQLLPYIAKRFPMDSLDGITLGNISDHPDLAVSLTNAYAQKFGSLDHPIDPSTIPAFLNSSGAATDFNRLLLPYATSVKQVGFEDLTISKSTAKLLDRNAVADTGQIPEKVLDGMLYIYFR
jgi:hypothetical protein